MKIAGGIMMVIAGLLIIMGTIITTIKYDANCGSYLEQVTHANTLGMARNMLIHAVNYADRHHLTSGNTAVFVPMPVTDIAIWHNNITDGLEAIQIANEEGTSLAASITLIQLYESIRSCSPQNLAFYPHVGLWLIGWCCIPVLILGGFLVIFRGMNERTQVSWRKGCK